MSGYPIIGGKADGQKANSNLVQITREGESYLLMSFKKTVGNSTFHYYFYMLSGMIPAEAIKIYQERHK